MVYEHMITFEKLQLIMIKTTHYDFMIDGRNCFDQTVKNGLWTNDNISEIATGQSNDYTTVCLLDYPYFEEYYVLIWIDLIKQQKLNANPEEMQQTSFTVNLDRARNTQMFSIIGEAKEIVLDFSKRTKKILKFSFFLIQ